MARTFRNTAHANLNSRRITTRRQLALEARAAASLRAAGFAPRPRVAGAKGRIPDRMDDLRVAAYSEQHHVPWADYRRRVDQELDRGLPWRLAWDVVVRAHDAAEAAQRQRDAHRKQRDAGRGYK